MFCQINGINREDMMNTKGFNFQRGGMLLELMLSVALAAIIIPFVFRYQKNTIERARNIAIVKQMETVQSALERCIFENREVLLRQGVSVFSENNTDPDVIDCLILSNYDDENPRGLINYGLTVEFANDFKNDYKLRILKSADNTDQPVLQGVVLLNNQNINALRTREIVRLGGGKVGFLDGDNVQGGYNSFQTLKTEFSFNNIDEGIIQTTDTMRGYSKYLWRLPSGSEDDATMLSWLNLDGHDIDNVNDLRAYNAGFSMDLTIHGNGSDNLGNIIASNTYFTKPTTIKSDCMGDKAIVRGYLTINSGGTLNVTEKLTARGIGKFSDCVTPNLTSYEMTLTKFSIDSKYLIVGRRMVIPETVSGTITVGDGRVITPRLVISKRITSPDRKFYWEVDGKSKNEANFYDITLTGMGYEKSGLLSMLDYFVKNDENSFNGSSGGDFANSKFHLFSRDFFWNTTKNVLKVENVSQSLTELHSAQTLINRKYHLIEACSYGKYKDDTFFKQFCALNGVSYVCESYESDGIHCSNSNSGKLEQYINVITGCHALYPDEGKGSSGYDIYDDQSVIPNPPPVVESFALCLSCTGFVGKQNGLDYVNACVSCSKDKSIHTGSALQSCIDDYIAHPK